VPFDVLVVPGPLALVVRPAGGGEHLALQAVEQGVLVEQRGVRHEQAAQDVRRRRLARTGGTRHHPHRRVDHVRHVLMMCAGCPWRPLVRVHGSTGVRAGPTRRATVSS
jgi:hypothetical protein